MSRKDKNTAKRSFIEDWRLIARGFKLIYEICPQNMAWKTIDCIAHQLAPYYTLFMSAQIISCLARGDSIRTLLTFAAVNVIGQLLLNIATNYTSFKAEEMSSVNFDLNELYMMKVQCRMQYKHLENPETAQLRQKIRDFSNYGGHGLDRLYYNYGIFLSSIFNIAFSVSLTASMFKTVSGVRLDGFLAFVNTPLSCVLIVAVIGLNIMLQMLNINYFEPKIINLWGDWNKRFALSNRYMQGQGNADTIVMGAIPLVLDRCAKTLKDMWHLKKNLAISVKKNTASAFLNTVTNILLYLYVGAKVYIGTFGVGSFFLYVGAVEKFVRAVSDLGSSVGGLRQNNEYLIELYRFLDLPDEMYHGTLSVEKRVDNKFEIEFRNVSFKYPGADDYALKNVSFKFRIGERLAFVGTNGSGKTTFVKLLCRLYDPTEGEILLKGIDISKYDYNQYLRLFSVVFQDIFLFAFSLGENISAQMDYDADRVRECLYKVNFGEKLESLKKGLETSFGFMYEEDGVEFSEGEDQKIVLARALYKDAPYIILDEPTAALDPIAEAEVYAHFNEIVGEKTAIYISHRLSSCRFADKIVVFDNGRIVEQGNHDTLVADVHGKYYELWHAQAKYYAKEGE